MLIEGVARCRAAGDRTNEREYIEDLGKTCGAFDVGMHLDVTVKRDYDAALEEQAHLLARVLLENMGDKVLGLSAPAIEVQVEQRGVESTNAGQVAGSVGEGGDRPAECTLERPGDAGACDREALDALADHDGDGHLRSEPETQVDDSGEAL